MINIIRNRDTKIVYAVVGGGNVVITETETTYDGDVFTIDSEFPYTWGNGYECVQAELKHRKNGMVQNTLLIMELGH